MSKQSVQEEKEKQSTLMHKLLELAGKAKDIVIHKAKAQNDVFIVRDILLLLLHRRIDKGIEMQTKHGLICNGCSK